jgi:hypothetical protein
MDFMNFRILNGFKRTLIFAPPKTAWCGQMSSVFSGFPDHAVQAAPSRRLNEPP